jgi:hypothetical protein
MLALCRNRAGCGGVRIENLSSLHLLHQHLINVILRLAKAFARHALALRIAQHDALAGGCHQLLGDAFVAHAEFEFFGDRAGHRGQQDLAFPGLADPSFFREFLQEAGALAFRVGKVQRDPGVGDEGEQDGAEQG